MRRRYLKLFDERHKHVLKICTLECNETKTHAAVSAEIITTHFAVLEYIIAEYKIGCRCTLGSPFF